MAGSYIVAGARTPIGKMSGALSSFSAAQLGGFAIKAALERAGVKPEDVEHVIMGQVLTAGQGQVPSRQAASLGGIPMNVPFTLRNKHPFPLMSQPAARGALALPPPFRSATHAGLVLLTTTN